MELTRATPALVNGVPVILTILKNGAFVYQAAKDDGTPLFLENGLPVAIDPQTGRHRSKVLAPKPDPSLAAASLRTSGFFDNANKEPFTSNGLALAIECASNRQNNVRDSVPHQYETNKVIARQRLATRLYLALLVFIARAVTISRRLWFRVFPSTRVVTLESFVSRALSVPAKALLQRRLSSAFHVVDATHVAVLRVAHLKVPVSPSGHIPTVYLARWAAFLNDMERRGIWKYGSAGLSQVNLASEDLGGRRAILTAAIYTDVLPEDDSLDPNAASKALNTLVGFDVFLSDPSTDADFTTFPW